MFNTHFLNDLELEDANKSSNKNTNQSKSEPKFSRAYKISTNIIHETSDLSKDRGYMEVAGWAVGKLVKLADILFDYAYHGESEKDLQISNASLTSKLISVQRKRASLAAFSRCSIERFLLIAFDLLFFNCLAKTAICLYISLISLDVFIFFLCFGLSKYIS